MRFIHIADVHLFATPDTEFEWGEKRPQEIEETFEKVLDACNEKNIDLLLIAGNLYDRSPSVEDLIYIDEKSYSIYGDVSVHPLWCAGTDHSKQLQVVGRFGALYRQGSG